jgi:ubiquinone/menaquinone biosynthesis C-methylase UbiE
MTIDFHEEKNRQSYASRQASRDWCEAMQAIAEPAGKIVVDIGCGGGIYCKAWAQLRADRVIGVDFSRVMLSAAEENCRDQTSISFWLGDAHQTGLPSQSADIVFSRAVIHHLADLPAFFSEARRLLRPGGLCLVQDRTPEDVRLPGSPEHIRGYFFACHPRLLELENRRRPSMEAVRSQMREAGFEMVQAVTLWETRQEYSGMNQLADDLRQRTGRSILHELSDEELEQLITYIQSEVGHRQPITEKDRWTLWKGVVR